ncbi:hypothetical protein [Rhodococcoides yunnanense]|uniref:hypothetical protein n=1 Tax=Rhodococcoides yunnanense TaxID=278209 RepID=UPI000933ABC6|nr:hypothetical protein [Rhodococcus yunnanensis]
MRRSRYRSDAVRLLVSSAATAALIAPLIVVTGSTAAADPSRTETPWASSSTVDGVISSEVTLRVPLPAEVAPHPDRCDTLSYLRWRSSSGPEDSAAADRILVAQPGVFEGAGAFDSVARNTVAAAAAEGNSVEFWALDRRSNCLEDHHGVQAALKTRDFDTAANYYFSGEEVDGRTFAGYADGPDTRWLESQGLEQTLRDQYDILRLELPDPRTRKDKVLCGGHSLGGFLTGYFAEWDFDGNAATTDDAGYNQCSGYFALDTVIKAGLPAAGAPDLGALPPFLTGPLEQASLALDSAYPVLRLPAVINPETTNLLALAGLAATLDPDGVNALLDRAPKNTNIDLTLRTLLSKDAAMAVTGSPDVRNLRATNEATVGALLDDNSQPLGFLQSSMGFFTGGPVVDKSFPLPSQIALGDTGSGAFGDAHKASPAVYGNPDVTYRWLDYDEVGTAASLPDEGSYTNRDSEVSSVAEVARSLSEPPLDFTEWYFPSRLNLDLGQAGAPSIAENHLHLDGVNRNPIVTFHGGGGIALPESNNPADVPIVLPGYNHIDVLTAAPVQNNGRPEVVSTTLARFAANPSAGGR